MTQTCGGTSNSDGSVELTGDSLLDLSTWFPCPVPDNDSEKSTGSAHVRDVKKINGGEGLERE